MAWDIGFAEASSSSSSSSSSTSSSSSSRSSSSSSKSSSSTAGGTVVWGHKTGVTEQHARPLNNWTEDQGWTRVGPAGFDAETLQTDATSRVCSQISESEDWNLGPMEAIIRLDKYQTGSGPAPTFYYKTSATQGGLAGEGWTLYNGVSFTSVGWIKLRIIHV